MSTVKTVKICVVGPKGCGKSALVKLLVEGEDIRRTSTPTIAVRIQELEKSLPRIGLNAVVRFFDCSGDKQYQRCWPALAHSTLGLLLVYDADKGAAEQEAELEDWYRAFGQPNALRENQSLIIGIQQKQAVEPSELQGKLRKLQHKVLDLYSAQQANLRQVADAVDTVIAAAVDAAMKDSQHD